VCVHYHLSTKEIIYCHFIAIRKDKEPILSRLEKSHFTPYIKINNKPQKLINNELNISMICENNYENTSDKKEHIVNNTQGQEK
jgi:hypothetical protein